MIVVGNPGASEKRGLSGGVFDFGLRWSIWIVVVLGFILVAFWGIFL